MFSVKSDQDMVACPYDKTHRMLRKRLQPHIIKCRVNFPDVLLKTCPFDQTHLIPIPEFDMHVTSCPGRKLISQYKYDAPEVKEEGRVKQERVECDENWDDTDVQDYNPQKYIEKAQVLRKPDGVQPGQRKAFVKLERKRLGDLDSEDEAEANLEVKKEEGVNGDEECERPPTPPPPSWSSCLRSTVKRSASPPSPVRQSYGKQARSDSPLRRSLSADNNSNSAPFTRRNSTEYSADEDPYYNGGGDSNGFETAHRQALSGYGAHRGHPHRPSYLGVRWNRSDNLYE